jgi:hypothetical protein
MISIFDKTAAKGPFMRIQLKGTPTRDDRCYVIYFRSGWPAAWIQTRPALLDNIELY